MEGRFDGKTIVVTGAGQGRDFINLLLFKIYNNSSQEKFSVRSARTLVCFKFESNSQSMTFRSTAR